MKMKSRTRLIFDGNSHLNQALLRGIDHDEGRVVKDDAGKDVQVNSARYAFDGFFDKVKEHLTELGGAPRDILLVWDGPNSKARRRTFLPQYKSGRDKHPAVSEQLNIARDMVTKAAYHLGITVMQQDAYEADDVIGYLCRKLRTSKNVVCTADGDLSVLHDENTDIYRLGEYNKNPCGPFPHKYITLYKSLVGDTTDKIPGAVKFGEGKFIDLVRIFGLEGLDEMIRMIEEGELDQLKESIADLPALKLVMDQKDLVTTCYRVASLHIDEIDTMKRPLQINPGMVGQWDEVDPELRVHDLRQFYGTKTLVTAANYNAARRRVAEVIGHSPFVALDIETSTPEASDEWVEQIKAITENDRDRFDALGHELTGMSLTFGDNTQHTIYMTVDHAQSDNISLDQCREMVELIPHKGMFTVIQNRQFEFSVLYRTGDWANRWKDNGYAGFVPNAIDTKIGASYTDENFPNGLKERSKLHLGYEQATYDETTTLHGPAGSLKGGIVRKAYDKEIEPAITQMVFDEKLGVDVPEIVVPAKLEPWEARQYKMNELTAAQVFDYGCDDTICTAALHTFYALRMELENTWWIYMQVEQRPEYLTSLAFVQGAPISLAKVREMEVKDDKAYNESWSTLRAFLLKNGWEGTVCPEFEGSIEPADVKMAAEILLEGEFTTKKRKLNAIAADLLAQFPDNDMASVLAAVVEANDVVSLNRLVRDAFTGEPRINFGSPKQLQRLFYHVMRIPPKVVNKLTDKQREDPVYRSAFKKLRKSQKGQDVTYEDDEWIALVSKASTDEDAVRWALAKDKLSPEVKAALEAYATIRKVMTRRSLFYKSYKALGHWRDGRIHPSMNQCEAVTRRYSSSNPNAQQMPKRGEAVEFREVVVPHCKDAVVVSLDFNGQELRSMAEQSGDANLTACYVGDNLKDPHGLTAAEASKSRWEKAVTYEEFLELLETDDAAAKKKAKDLRNDAKIVNFGTNYDMQAPALALELLVDDETAQEFIDSKDRAMPGIGIWKSDVCAEARRLGYVTTMLGARRHLRAALTSDNKWDAARADRQGPNFKIQGSCAEQGKLALGSMWDEGLFNGNYNAQFYFPVHDEVVFSVHKDDALEVIRKAHACMVQPYADQKVPIISSISLGRNFGQQIECGEEVDEATISAAIEEALAA